MSEKSGRLLVRLPKSLHKALADEAAREAVSLNQLIISKLSIPLLKRLQPAAKGPSDAR